MIAVDANLLVYAHITAFAQHQAAREWLEDQLAHAWGQAEAWLDAGPSWTPTPTSDHRQILRERDWDHRDAWP